MPDTLQQQFVNELKARLEGISTTLPNLIGYATDPKGVYEWREVPLNTSELPALIIRDLENDQSQKRVDIKSGKQYNILYMQIQVECFDIVLIRLLTADIWKAIGTDREWGYKAIDTRPIKLRHAVEQEGYKVTGALVDFAIDYISNTFDAYE